VVATSATTPVLRGEWLAPGAHINAVGATRPNWRELDDELLHRSTIYVESREPALKESGDVIAADKELIEIGEVIAGKQSGRKSADQITLFKSVGVAIEDIATAELVLKANASAPRAGGN
jgi:ornithine cyclodeaminase/alanine dehydrogenase-like protein (mu-crystallin family)